VGGAARLPHEQRAELVQRSQLAVARERRDVGLHAEQLQRRPPIGRHLGRCKHLPRHSSQGRRCGAGSS